MEEEAAVTSPGSTSTAAGYPSDNAVKLLIKASNQQFEDQEIDCDLLWTVKRLKTKLSVVYPSKPPVGEQKLIYSGQLLSDNLVLKDVIRNYKDVYTHNHIFHLVYTPKSPPKSNIPKTKPNSENMGRTVNANNSFVSGNGLRQRNVRGNGSAQQPDLSQPHLSPQYPQTQQQQLLHQTRQQYQQHLIQQQQYLQNHRQYMQQQQQYLRQHPLAPSAMSNQQTAPRATHTVNQTVTPAGPPIFTNSNNNGTNYNNNSNSGDSGLMPLSFPSNMNMQTFVTQQIAMYNWINQVYSNYMDEFMRQNSNAGLVNATSPNLSGIVNGGPAALQIHPFSQYMPFTMPNATVAGAEATATMNPVISSFPSASATTVVAQPQMQTASLQAQAPLNPPMGAADVIGAERAQQQPQQQPPQQQVAGAAQQRFPNILQDEQENRDWLDSFLSIMRLALFLTVLYFNSSPLRCLAVVLIAGLIYLYHVGVLRFRQEHNNNNINRNNNVDQIRQGVQQVQEQQHHQQGDNVEEQQQQPLVAADQPDDTPNPERENPASDDSNINNAVNNVSENLHANNVPAGAIVGATGPVAGHAAEQLQRGEDHSIFSVVRTFVVTFITSMLPETPAL